MAPKMETLLTFVAPVRHPENARDWPAAKAKLAQTLASISAQTDPRWRCVVVANHGADLPAPPAGVEILRVDFAPNPHHERGGLDPEPFYDAFRLDKGRRVHAGFLKVRDTAFYMIVDDDDLVSNRLVEFVARNTEANGWYVDNGYVWGSGGRWLYAVDRFNELCGTSLIVRRDLYDLPERFEATSARTIGDMLGSHWRIRERLAARGQPLAPLPFRGAVYRVGHECSHSRSPGLVGFFMERHAPQGGLRDRLRAWWKHGANFRPLGRRVAREYFARP